MHMCIMNKWNEKRKYSWTRLMAAIWKPQTQVVINRTSHDYMVWFQPESPVISLSVFLFHFWERDATKHRLEAEIKKIKKAEDEEQKKNEKKIRKRRRREREAEEMRERRGRRRRRTWTKRTRLQASNNIKTDANSNCHSREMENVKSWCWQWW